MSSRKEERKRKPKYSTDNLAQSRRFIEVAETLDSGESSDTFYNAIGKIARKKGTRD